MSGVLIVVTVMVCFAFVMLVANTMPENPPVRTEPEVKVECTEEVVAEPKILELTEEEQHTRELFELVVQKFMERHEEVEKSQERDASGWFTTTYKIEGFPYVLQYYSERVFNKWFEGYALIISGDNQSTQRYGYPQFGEQSSNFSGMILELNNMIKIDEAAKRMEKIEEHISKLS